MLAAQPPSAVSATPAVAVIGLLLVAAVLSVLVVSFVLHRRSGRR